MKKANDMGVWFLERKKEEWRKEFQLLFLEKKKIPPSCNKNNTENMKTAALE